LFLARLDGRGTSEGFRAWMIVHVCATFATWLSYVLSELPKLSQLDVEPDRRRILRYPPMVYLALALLAVVGGKEDFFLLLLLLQAFRGKAR
jgi:hypothetical protein